MLLSVMCLLLSIIDVISAFNQHPKVSLPFSRNEVLDCRLEDILNIISLEDLQILIDGLASRTAISPFHILKKLHRRFLNQNGLHELPVTESPAPSVFEFPLEAPYSVSPRANEIDENIVIVPVHPPSMKFFKDSHLATNNVEEIFKHNRLKPPMQIVLMPMQTHDESFFASFISFGRKLGANVRVDSGDPLSPITREISLTVSPFMTFIEALRQAERKYQNVLGLSDDTQIITFAHSDIIDCYTVNSIVDIEQNEEFGWKVTVTDRDNQVVYDSFCLPSNNDVFVKAGSEISLSYVPM